jgi:DNA-directed RNA polymerase specialized sigma24 family protein
MKRTPPDPRAAAKRAAINALRRARRAADRAGVDLSPWEDEFLGSVESRVTTFGRAFGDPEKGAPGQALSLLQSVKLRQISRKARARALERAAQQNPSSAH